MVSLIIPTLNAADRLRELFGSLNAQTLRPDEVLVIDSSSDDDTLNVAREFGARTISIPRDEFDHGGTRNTAARVAKGDILLLMTQDALPAAPESIERLMNSLDDDYVAAAYGRQLPYAGATPFAAHLRRFNYPGESRSLELDDRNKLGLRTAFFSNSFAAYKKSSLEEIGLFREGLLFGEDTCAAAKLLLGGHRIIYQADATVYHSHNNSMAGDFRRYFDIGVLHKTEGWLLREFGGTGGEGIKYVRSELSYLLGKDKAYLIPEALIRNALKLAGYRAGRCFGLIPRVVARSLSMNRAWWDRQG